RARGRRVLHRRPHSQVALRGEPARREHGLRARPRRWPLHRRGAGALSAAHRLLPRAPQADRHVRRRQAVSAARAARRRRVRLRDVRRRGAAGAVRGAGLHDGPTDPADGALRAPEAQALPVPSIRLTGRATRRAAGYCRRRDCPKHGTRPPDDPVIQPPPVTKSPIGLEHPAHAMSACEDEITTSASGAPPSGSATVTCSALTVRSARLPFLDPDCSLITTVTGPIVSVWL